MGTLLPSPAVQSASCGGLGGELRGHRRGADFGPAHTLPIGMVLVLVLKKFLFSTKNSVGELRMVRVEVMLSAACGFRKRGGLYAGCR